MAINTSTTGWVVTDVIVKDLVTTHQIRSTVCRLLGYNENEIVNTMRRSNREVTEARWLYCYYSRLLTSKKLNKIAEEIMCDHTTVIHGIKRMQDLIHVNDDKIMHKISLIEDELKRKQFLAVKKR